MWPALSVGHILAAALAAATLTVGISDQNATAFADPRLTDLARRIGLP